MLAERKRLVTAGSRVRLRLLSDERLVSLVRRGDAVAFEVLYERHSGALLSFCAYMLGSRADAEDSVQATFVSAYRTLRADRRQVTVRPWLFTIARNHCVDTLRARRETVELNGEPAPGGEPAREFELREEVAHIFEGLRELPERQRAALALAELHGLSQADIGTVLGVESHQVKGYVYQARSNLLSERRAREADCCEIREEIATARGAALLRGRLRRHIRSCADCRTYADGISRQRRQLAGLMPLVPSLLVKARALEDALAGAGLATDPAAYAGGAAIVGSVGAAAEVAGSGLKALAVKAVAGLLAVGAATGAGASILGLPVSEGHAPHLAIAGRSSVLTASLGSPAAKSDVSGQAQARGLASGGAGRGAALTRAGSRSGRSGGREGRGQREASAKNQREPREPSQGHAAPSRERRSRSDASLRPTQEARAKEGAERTAKRLEARRERQERRATREAARRGASGSGSPESKGEEGTKVGRSPAPKEHRPPKEHPKAEGEEEVPKVGGSGAPKGKERRQQERERQKKRREREQRHRRREKAEQLPG